MAEFARTFVLIWLALLSLLAATIAVSFFQLGPFNLILNMGIATAKTLLVMWFFMHVRRMAGVPRIFVGAGFFWLSLLLGIGIVDWLTR